MEWVDLWVRSYHYLRRWLQTTTYIAYFQKREEMLWSFSTLWELYKQIKWTVTVLSSIPFLLTLPFHQSSTSQQVPLKLSRLCFVCDPICSVGIACLKMDGSFLLKDGQIFSGYTNKENDMPSLSNH